MTGISLNIRPTGGFRDIFIFRIRLQASGVKSGVTEAAGRRSCGRKAEPPVLVVLWGAYTASCLELRLLLKE